VNLQTKVVGVHVHFYPESGSTAGSLDLLIGDTSTTVLCPLEQALQLILAGCNMEVSSAPKSEQLAPQPEVPSEPVSFGGDYVGLPKEQKEEEEAPFVGSYFPKKPDRPKGPQAAAAPRTLLMDEQGNPILDSTAYQDDGVDQWEGVEEDEEDEESGL